MPRRKRHAEHKGVSLPINMIVILSIAVLVLVVVAAYFIGVFSKSGNSIGDQDAWNRGCGRAQARGCQTNDFNEAVSGGLTVPGFDPDGTGGDNSLFDACKAVYGNSETSLTCRVKCCG